jgi:MFS superfamily sulfate permease-like transporter
MKLGWLLLALLVGMLAAIGTAIAVGEVPNGHGYADAVFASIQVAGDSPERTSQILWLGWAFGALQIAFFVACLELGLRRRVPGQPEVRPWRRSLWLWGGVFEAVWSALVVVYWRYASSGSSEIWWGLPAPTAIMLYGIWLLPIAFCLLYMVRFDRWVMSEADLARFHELVAAAAGADRTGRTGQPDRPDSP